MDPPTASQSPDFDDDWEEWDGTSPFWIHCVAGSMAGVSEHVLVYPLDTVRTHIQVCAACNFNPNTHNASTQAASLAAAPKHPSNKPSSVPGAILQQAGVTKNAKQYNNHLRSSSVVMTKTTPTPNAAAFRGVSSSGLHNLSMLQAFRQLVAPPSASLASATATAATLTNTTHLQSTAGMTRLWRGVQTILIGCIPAHAIYFSTYEIVKGATRDAQGNVTGWGSALAGGAAVFGHDLVLGPLDTIKQRLQLGHYQGLTDALRQMIKNEGAISLYRSFPVTLATNIPYGMIMVGTNEFLKDQWTQPEEHSKNNELTLGVTLGASSLAGLVAAATTTPLDRIKTYLQTQQLAPSCLLQHSKGPEQCPLNGTHLHSGVHHPPIVADWRQAMLRIYQQEGMAGFFRGMTPRILSHTPAVAISWTTYETFKKHLQRHFQESVE